MLPRSNTTASDRLRRAKSTASLRSSTNLDPFVVRQHAEAAASQAYRLSQPVQQVICPDYRPAPPMLRRRKSQVTGRSEGSHLEDARLGRRRSTVRRDEKKDSPSVHHTSNAGPRAPALKENEPRARQTVPARPNSDIKASNRKERLIFASSGYQRRPLSTSQTGSPCTRSTSAISRPNTPMFAQTPRYTEKSYDDGISVNYKEPHSYAERTKVQPPFQTRRASIRETQTDEEIIALARDRCLEDFQNPKVRERKSFFGSFQKLQKWNVSSKPTGGITYDGSLPPFNYADDSLVAPLPPTHDLNEPFVLSETFTKSERKTRIFSGSVKDQFKKILRKASRAPSGLLAHPVEEEQSQGASLAVNHEALHTLESSADPNDPFVVSNPHDSPTHNTEVIYQSFSIGSNPSINGDSAADKSRVTSWTNSTVAGTTSTRANTVSTSVADEHGRLQRSDSCSTLRKKGSFFGRAVQNRLRKSSRADLKGSEDSQALFAALRERIAPAEQQQDSKDRVASAASHLSQASSSLSSLPSQRRADSLGHGKASTIRTVSPDPDAFKMQTMSPLVEASPDRTDAENDAVDQTPATNHYASRRRSALVHAAPPSPERIARRVQQSQSRWQGAMQSSSMATGYKSASTCGDDNPYTLPSLARNSSQDINDTGGLPQHTKIGDPRSGDRERLLSPSVYSRATDGASPRAATPEVGGMTVKITSREIKRYDISPPKKPALTSQKPVQSSGEWREWLSGEINGLTAPSGTGGFIQGPEAQLASNASTTESSGRERASSASHRRRSDTLASDQASKGRRETRNCASSRRSSYMNERYPMVDSLDNPSRQSHRTSRKFSSASNAGTDTERSLQLPSSDDSKRSVERPRASNRTGAAAIPKRHSFAHLDSSAKTPPTEHATSNTLTMSGALPNTTSTQPTTTHHKHRSAFDLRAKYKHSSTSAASRPLEVRRKNSTTTAPPKAAPIPMLEDNTIINISAGPYADLAPPVVPSNKENTPPPHASGEESGGLPAVSSSEWLAGPGGRKKGDGGLKVAKGAGYVGREGSPGQRLVTGWLRGRGGGVGMDDEGGEGAFV